MVRRDDVKALVFDVFGTVVDWRSSCIHELTSFGNARGIKNVNWADFADEWRGLYQPSMEEVRTKRREFTILDTLHRESLVTLLRRYDIPLLCEHEIGHLVTIWHRLTPWPDAVEGLYRLKRNFIIGPLSNGNIGLLTRMAKHGGLPWDVILGAEVAQHYKPEPEAYRRTAQALNLKPHECMLIAAHNDDLQAAANVGFCTGFVVRPTEHGPNSTKDQSATRAWDIVTDSFNGVADAMGCARY